MIYLFCVHLRFGIISKLFYFWFGYLSNLKRPLIIISTHGERVTRNYSQAITDLNFDQAQACDPYNHSTPDLFDIDVGENLFSDSV